MSDLVDSVRDWLDSVRGLCAHIRIARAMITRYDGVPLTPKQVQLLRDQEEALRDQEGMIGHRLLYVLRVYRWDK